MIGQYLSNANESATLSILPKNLEVNKAQDSIMKTGNGIVKFNMFSKPNHNQARSAAF